MRNCALSLSLLAVSFRAVRDGYTGDASRSDLSSTVGRYGSHRCGTPPRPHATESDRTNALSPILSQTVRK